MTNQSDARTEPDLDEVERRATVWTAFFNERGYADTNFADSVPPDTVLALVAECRRLRAERGRLVNTTRHRDVTLDTYERPNESESGGE